jgi:hypothetical protein
MRAARILLLLLLVATGLTVCAQRRDSLPYNWMPRKPHYLREPSFFLSDTTLNKPRVRIVAGTYVGGYTAGYGLIAWAWYRDYEKSKFHWFNDNHEWAQIDKAGHFFSGYVGARGMIGLFKWSGMNRKQSALWGGAAGALSLVPIELLDGFAKDWGASYGDIIADVGGAALATGNELLWSEQRLQMKVSYHPTAYRFVRPDIFGDEYSKFLKDYNGHTAWLSCRVHSFLPEGKFRDKYPKWLNVAVGYGANGMLGGYENGITPEIREREYRQYYLAFDIDLTQIKTRSGFLDTMLGILNVVHLPSPTLEYNGKHGLRWHWLYM